MYWPYRQLYFIHSINRYVLRACHGSGVGLSSGDASEKKSQLFWSLYSNRLVCVARSGGTGMGNKQVSSIQIIPGGKCCVHCVRLMDSQLRSQGRQGSQTMGRTSSHPQDRFCCLPKTFSPCSIAPCLPMAGTCLLSRSPGALLPPGFQMHVLSFTYLPPACLCPDPWFPLCLKPWLCMTLTSTESSHDGKGGDAVFGVR